MIICLFLELLFLVLSIFLFMGKGSWLIAGYNTLSEEDKKKYDKKKLCRITGLICLVVAVFLGVLSMLIYLA